MEEEYLYPWLLISCLHFYSFPSNHSFKFFKNIHLFSFILPSTISRNLIEREDLYVYQVSTSLLHRGWSFIFVVCGGEASYECSVLVMMNSFHCGWSLSLLLNLSIPPWVLGGVEFGMNTKESQVLFGVPCSVFGPCLDLYIEGVRLWMQGWLGSRRRDHYMRRKS